MNLIGFYWGAFYYKRMRFIRDPGVESATRRANVARLALRTTVFMYYTRSRSTRGVFFVSKQGNMLCLMLKAILGTFSLFRYKQNKSISSLFRYKDDLPSALRSGIVYKYRPIIICNVGPIILLEESTAAETNSSVYVFILNRIIKIIIRTLF